MKALEEILDRDAALATALNDASLLGKLVDLFADYYPELLDELRDAISANDADRVREAAHRVKGAVGTFHAREAAESAVKLEELAKSGSLDDAMVVYRCLAEHVLTLVDALGHLVDETQAIR